MAVPFAATSITTADPADHNTQHENGGADEVVVTGLSGLLADDQHVLDSEVIAVAIAHALSTAANDFLVGSGSNTYIKKTLAETLVILGKAAASGLASLDGSSLVVQNPANATATPTASKIPIADGSGLLNGWISAAIAHTLGFHHSKACTYISGTGTAGADNTAQTVKTVTLPANSLTQVGDRVRVRTYWQGDTGAPITCTQTLNTVTIAHTTDSGGASLFIDESWIHYIDNTHANIIETEAGALGAVSAPNVAGFTWDANQDIDADQDAVIANHIIVFAIIVDVLPKGLI